MTLQLDVENLSLPATLDRGGRVLAAIRDALVARGWTVMGSGSGTIGAAFANTEQTAGPYDVFTAGTPWQTGLTPGVSNWSYASGNADSFSHYGAWIRLREPSTTREWIFQRWTSASTLTTTSGYMNISFAPGGFTGGGADKDTPPTAPGFSRQFLSNAEWFDNTGTNTIVFNMLVSDVAKAQNVWPFMCVFYDSTSSSTSAGGLIYESLSDAHVGDPEPWVAKCGGQTITQSLPTTSTSTGWYLVQAAGAGADTSAAATTYALYNGTVPGTGWLATPGPDGKRRALPVTFGDSLETWKGVSDHIYYNPTTREYPSTHKVATTDARLYWGQFLIPWKQSVVPAV